MSLYSGLLRYLALPQVLRRDNRQSALRHWRFLRDSQYWSPQRLLDYQWRAFEKILRHAWEHSPYYREIMQQHGLTPESIKTFDDLPRLPILTRDMIYEHVDRMVCDTFERDRLQTFWTGGTTGQRAKFYRDQESFNIKLGGAWRFENYMGKMPCDKIALIWPAHVDFAEQTSRRMQIKDRYIYRQQFYAAGSPEPEAFASICRQWRDFNPRYLKVFPSAMYDLIEYMRDRKLVPPKTRAVLSTGEPLYDRQRLLFEDFLQAPVFDIYTSREVGNTACECPAHEGLHISMETSIVEFIQDGRPVEYGQEGDIVVTDLTNYGVPLIRYHMGDRGVPLDHQCSCGRGLRMMSAAVGRVSDDFFGRDGTRHSGSVLMYHLTVRGPAVGQLQVIQETLTDFTIRITNRPEPTEENYVYIKAVMKRVLGDDINLRFETVDEIPREKSGKVRTVLCRLEKPDGSQ